ncbi:MAG: recombination mediator RecR [Gammaproteobacteria bacterium]
MSFSPLIQELIDALRYLPGVGPKSAQRMALHLLQHNKQAAQNLSETITKALDRVGQCHSCRTLSETTLCQICSNPKRNPFQLCIVENPADIFAIEQTSMYNGVYFVLMGHLSPIDGIGPEDLGIPLLKEKLSQSHFSEIILAINPTVEGQTTMHYLASVIKPLNIPITRIAQGIPLGSELEYTDGSTIAHAFIDRKVFATEE